MELSKINIKFKLVMMLATIMESELIMAIRLIIVEPPYTIEVTITLKDENRVRIVRTCDSNEC